MNLLNSVEGHSFLHRCNPITKLAAAFLYGMACILCGSIVGELMLIALMILIASTAHLAGRAVKLTIRLLILGLLMFLIQLFFVRTGDPILVVGSFVLITKDGLISALLLSLRVVATMLPLMLLFAITEINDLCNALVKTAHIPYRYAFIVTTAFRFVPILATEYHDIEDAQKSRGVDIDTRNIFRKIKLVVPLTVPLLVSSLKKVDSSAISAEMRGFAQRTRASGYKEYPFGVRDLVVFVFLAACIACSVMFLRDGRFLI